MERRISFSRGKGKLRHNNRDMISSNVDKDRIKDNVIIKQQSLGEAYEEIFGEARNAYNAKQKRKDRQIDNYFEKLFGKEPTDTILTNSNKQQSFYEYVVGIGDMFDTGLVDKILKDGTEVKANRKTAKIATECLTEYANGFQKRNPNFCVFNAVIHLDESTPHLHLDTIPFADSYKKGMTRQQGIAKALEAMGYGKGEDAIKRFTEAERNVLKEICEAHGIAIAKGEKGRGQDIATRIYGEVQDGQRELDKIRQEINEEKIKKDILETKVSELQKQKEFTELEIVKNSEVPPPPKKTFDEKPTSPYGVSREQFIKNSVSSYLKLFERKRQEKEVGETYDKGMKKYEEQKQLWNKWESDNADYNEKYGVIIKAQQTAERQEIVDKLQKQRQDEINNEAASLKREKKNFMRMVAQKVKGEVQKLEIYDKVMTVGNEWKDRYERIFQKPYSPKQQSERDKNQNSFER